MGGACASVTNCKYWPVAATVHGLPNSGGLLRPFSVIVSFALALTTAACASAPSRAARESPDRITSEEIRASGITNALDLINRLRPAWLRPTHTGAVGAGIRSQAIAVYLDGHR